MRITKAVRKESPDVSKIVDALIELIKQLSREQGMEDNWRRKPKR